MHVTISDRLIEAHGRAGLYKCSSDPDVEDGCPYANDKTIAPDEFNSSIQAQLGHGTNNTAPELCDVPLCPHCNSPCMPQALLFGAFDPLPFLP